VFGLDAARALVTTQGLALPGPWQKVWALEDRDGAVLLLVQPNAALTVVEPAATGCRVLLRDATFAMAQSRPVPAEYGDARLGVEVPVVFAGQTAQDAQYTLFARVAGQLHGPFAAATSEAATAAMWLGLLPVVDARRAEFARQQALAAAALADERAAQQRSVDAAKARLAEIGRHQDAYFDSIQAGDAAGANRAVDAIDDLLRGFQVPPGHPDTESMQKAQSLANAYRLDWELRRDDRGIDRIAHWGLGYLGQGGALYRRYTREVARLLPLREGIPRPTYDLLMQTSSGFDDATRAELRRHKAVLERFEAGERYRAHLAAGRFQQAHDMAYQLGFEDWVAHLQGPAKGRIPEHELEALLRAAVDRAPTPELRARLQAAHHAQWLDVCAEQRREQNERFRRLDEEQRRADAAHAQAAREARASYRLEALRRGFVWREN
jgi:hypothetical protein